MLKIDDWIGRLMGPRAAVTGTRRRRRSGGNLGEIRSSGTRRRGLPVGLEALEGRTLLTFGLTSTSSSYIVDTGAQLVFTVAKNNGDLTSIKYNGTELTAPYSQTQRYSHYESGLSSTNTTVTAAVNAASGTILIAATDSSLGVTQYYVARNGYNDIFMATYTAGTTPPDPGEMRYIFYMNKGVFPNIDPASNIAGDTIIEGQDVFENTTTGYTYSKFYSARPNITDPYHGVTGNGVGAFVMIGSREAGSGGPFFQDIAAQTTSAADEIYNYMYSGHMQTEAFRPGLQGPYALEVTGGGQPTPLDYSFMDNLGITGWVAASGRGSVSGQAVGLPAGVPITVGLSNANAQYWTAAPANATNGTLAYSIPNVLPGTYTETVYANELAVGTQTVTVTAGTNTTAPDLADSLPPVNTLWSIGAWDGTTAGFENASLLPTMHPSDVRMTPWAPSTVFTVGSSPLNTFPTAQWMNVNNNTQINFNLTAAQAVTPLTLRINITLAENGGRPAIVVNQGQTYQWTSALPAPGSQPNSRGITRGTFRGNNTSFTYNIPTSSLRAGANTVTIAVSSGSTDTGFLNPSIVYDSVDLETTTYTVAPPAPWTDQDVGSPGVPGGAAYAPGTGTYSVSGSGTGFGTTSDQLNFLSQSAPLGGSGTIVAQLNSLPSGTAGLVLRGTAATTDTASQAAAPAFAGVSADGTHIFLRYRSSDGGTTTYSTDYASLPVWLKLTWSGKTVSAFYSTDGTTFTQVGSTRTINFTATPQVGMFAYNSSSLTTAAFSNVNLTVNRATPVVTWSNPANITYGTALGASQLNATASVAGTFAYSVLPGTVLHAGNGQALSVTFTPNDTADYNIVTQQVLINVSPAPLTITANNKSMVYGGTMPSLTASDTGLVNGDTDSAIQGLILATVPSGSHVGSYAIAASGASDADYAITLVNGKLTITPAPLTITADNQSMAHYGAVPTLTYTLSGFFNGDTAGVVSGTASLSTTASPTSSAGRYPILVGAGTLSAGDYSFPNFVNGTLTVQPKVLDTRVHWGNQSMSLLGLNRDLPFVNITAIDVLFSDDVAVTGGSLALASTAAGVPYGFSQFSYDPATHDATWTLPTVLGIDRLMLSLDHTLGAAVDPSIPLVGPISWGFAVLPGDFSGDGMVTSADLVGIYNTTAGPYAVFADLNGDGADDINDVRIARTRIGTSL